jgi:UDP-glucose 4-epimerase
MRVLVTGAAGFLGSHLCDRLLASSHDVVGVDDLSSGRLENLAAARAAGLSFSRFDVTNDTLDELVARARPEVVCHLAGTPAGDPRVDVVGAVAVLSVAAAAGVRKVVLAGDAAVYGRPRSLPVSERAGLAPLTPYAASRAAVEQYAGAFPGLAVTTLVLGQVFGPRRTTGAVAGMATSLLRGEQLVLPGDGSPRLDLLYVDDAVDAFVRALGPAGDGRRLNVGSGVGVSLRQLHTLLAGLTSTPDEPRLAAAARTAPDVVLEVGAARRAIGWEPWTALPDGLAATVEALRGA